MAAARTRVRRRVRRKPSPKVRRAVSSGTQAALNEARSQIRGQGALMIGGSRDPAEQTADRMATAALAGGVQHKCGACSGSGGGSCPACAAKEEGQRRIGRTATPGPIVAPGAKAARATPEAAHAIGAMGTGRPLARAERAYFEPRFGRDLSQVRVHEGAAADRATRAVDASAFTHGNDIAFAKGARTGGGARLMAHELAHVVAEGASPARRLHRATLATADLASDATYKKVPDKHKPEVNAGLKLLDAQANKRCKKYFKDNCSAGGGDLAAAIKDATVYWKDDTSKEFGLSETRTAASDARTIAYNTYAYNVGRYMIGATLLHEMFHTCILGSIPNEEVVAETGVEECAFYSPWSLGHKPGTLDVGDTLWVHGFQFGPNQDADHYIKLGNTKITSYDKWVLDPSASWVEVEFKVPKSVNDNIFFSKTVDVVAVNHGVESNKRPLKVNP